MQCPVCFEELTSEEQAGSLRDKWRQQHKSKLVVTPCGHVFHRKCMVKWLDTLREQNESRRRKRLAQCPTCRGRVKRAKLYPIYLHNKGETANGSPEEDNAEGKCCGCQKGTDEDDDEDIDEEEWDEEWNDDQDNGEEGNAGDGQDDNVEQLEEIEQEEEGDGVDDEHVGVNFHAEVFYDNGDNAEEGYDGYESDEDDDF